MSTTVAGENVLTVLSMLHEPADRNSATRRFRGQPVLSWTLTRLRRARHVDAIAIVCWEDQLEHVVPIAEKMRADVLTQSPRTVIPEIENVSAAQRWADGWRGGLLGTCAFDRGFHAGSFEELAARLESDAVLVVDPSAGLVDANLVDDLVAHAREHETAELCFMPAAPGLSGVLIRRPLLKRLASAKAHPGRILHYSPDVISREMLGGEACAPVPTSVARTTDRFTLDSDRQVERIAAATVPLNGQLISSPAEDIVQRLRGERERVDALPCEVVLELNTNRATRPIFWPGRYQNISRSDCTLDAAKKLFADLESSAASDDLRLTIAGVGDPLLHGELFAIIDAARRAGIRAIHVETDLVQGDVSALANAPIDVVSVHVPAVSPQTYATVMGVDRYTSVLENIRSFVAARAGRGSGVPILVPTFVKCRDNLGEMEAWYDQWLRAVGSAVITGPSDYAGQIADVSVADMSPPKRRPCARLWSRVVVQSDGNVVACDQDFAGRHAIGNVKEIPLREIWQSRLEPLRANHRDGRFNCQSLCGNCREWHRP